MERVLRRFDSQEEAERAEREYYRSLTPEQRLDILLELVAREAERYGDAAQGLARVYRAVDLARS